MQFNNFLQRKKGFGIQKLFINNWIKNQKIKKKIE